MGSHGPRIQHFGLATGGGATYTVKVIYPKGTTVTRSNVVPTSESITIGSTTLNNTIEVFETGPTAVTLTSFAATGYDDGVLLEWRTGFEVDNLGFHVYREDWDGLTRITPEVLAGSALLAGAGRPLTSGRSYAWLDRGPDNYSARYWLEDLESRRHQQLARADNAGTRRTRHCSSDGIDNAQRAELPWGCHRGRYLCGRRPKKVQHRTPLKGGGKIRQASMAETEDPPEDRLEIQRALAAQPGVKFLVRRTGWKRVFGSSLLGAGLDPHVDPRKLHLYSERSAIPYGDERCIQRDPRSRRQRRVLRTSPG